MTCRRSVTGRLFAGANVQHIVRTTPEGTAIKNTLRNYIVQSSGAGDFTVIEERVLNHMEDGSPPCNNAAGHVFVADRVDGGQYCRYCGLHRDDD